MEKNNICKKILFNEKTWYFILLAIVIVFIISLCPKFMQNDTFWSIKVGEKLVNEGVWEIDDFSMHSGLKYIAHHFLTDVGIYWVYQIGGFQALYVMLIILTIIMAALLYILNKEICNNRLLSYFFLILQLILMQEFLAVRAQMISYILFIIEIILLEKSRKKDKKWYYVLLGIIPILLANFHMGVIPFYFILLGVYGLDALKIKFLWIKTDTKPDKKRFKKLLILGLIGLITIFINPYGIDGVIYPFKTIGNEFINGFIAEFQPFALTTTWTLYVVIYLFVVIITFMCNKSRVLLKDILLIFGTLFMTFTAYRYIGLFIICSAVILKYIKNILKEMKLEKLDIYAFSVAVVFCLVMISGNNFVYKTNEYVVEELAPKKAIQVVKDNMTEDTILFNVYEWGGYLMLNDITVYIDSRCDLYTQEYNEHTSVAKDYETLIYGKKNYKEVLDKYDFNMLLVETDSVLATLLSTTESYKEIYKDDVAIVYVK